MASQYLVVNNDSPETITMNLVHCNAILIRFGNI